MENNDGTPTSQPRITPLNSDGDDPLVATDPRETPWRTLNQLANIPRPTTPKRRASSAGPPSTHRSGRRTPGGLARTPGATQRIGSARRPIAVTPHGRAAARELESRRAGFTPGKDRRRSGRQQRETPRDTLRALSRILAPKSKPTVPTPSPVNIKSKYVIPGEDDDFDDGPDIVRPRLSLPLMDLEEDDEDEDLLLPPRSQGLEDEEEYTMQSVELGRRAVSERPPGRYSRGSYGSVRMSDVFADMDVFGGEAPESSYLARGENGDDDYPDMGDDSAIRGEATATLRGIGFDQGRLSDIRREDLGDETDEFMFRIPTREPSPEEILADDFIQFPNSEEPEIDAPGNLEAMEAEEQEAFEDIDDDEPNVTTDIQAMEADNNMQDVTMRTELSTPGGPGIVRKKKVKISKHGLPYPSLPVGVVKKLAATFARTAGNSKAKINKETLDAIMQATDWFFEQVSDDLGAYAKHAGRKTIDESDIITLMARQRQTNATTTPFSLAQKFLPRELLQELRMMPPSRTGKGRRLEKSRREE